MARPKGSNIVVSPSPSARVYLVTSYDDVGSDGETHAGPQFPNPLVVDGPGHPSLAYATFDPVAHSKLHDQVAMPDGNDVALFDADPEWQLIRIGLGLPACKTSVLVKVAPAPVLGLWIGRHCNSIAFTLDGLEKINACHVTYPTWLTDNARSVPLGSD